MADEQLQTPTLDQFLACCDEECAFLVHEYGFERLPLPREYNEYSVRFRKGELEVHVYGENWGKTASCDLVKNGADVFLGLLVPAAERSPTHKGERPGQLAQVRAIAALLRRFASDFLRGDTTRFDAALAEWRRITRPRPMTDAHRRERERQQAVTAAGHASRRGNHADVVQLLQPHAETLSGRQRRMLQEALEKLGRHTNS